MKKNRIHIVFSGGGTGGHLFPGLAVAEQLSSMIPRLRITFCGSGKAFERKHVGRAGFDYLPLASRPLPHGAREAVAFVVENLAGYISAQRFLRQEHVAAVVGLGGYTSAPMARAATRRGTPLVLLEQNAVPGRATRWLAGRASLVCTAFEQAGDDLRCGCPIRVTGNPIRRGFCDQSKLVLCQSCFDRWHSRPRLCELPGTAEGGCATRTCRFIHQTTTDRALVAAGERSLAGQPEVSNPQSPIPNLLILGGSGGARTLNEQVPRALYKIRHLLRGWRIVHQSGESGLEATQELYGKLCLPATVVPFVRDMPEVLNATGLAVCRAGGTTLAELAAAGVPAILLPYPHATDDHQAANARLFSAGGGCITIDQRELVGELDDQLADMLCFVLANGDLRRRMSAAMRAMARPNAAEDVAQLIWSIVSSRAVPAELATV